MAIQNNSDRKVCLLHVGGTIGMSQNRDGHLIPLQGDGFLASYLEKLPEITRPELPRYDVVQLDPLIDSADMVPADWQRIANEIIARQFDYDGFVVAHGTDTMAYTASALSFLLPGLHKPVVLTGAQLSLMHPRSDGHEHLITSLMLAGQFKIPEVAIYFAKSLLRGNRSQKVHNEDFVAFRSPNWPELARIGVHIALQEPFILPAGAGLQPLVAWTHEPKIAAVRLHPGFAPELLEAMMAAPLDGLVLETYGSGNAPTHPRLLEVLREAIGSRDTIVVNVSQCDGGRVRQSLYGTGAQLAQIGVMSGADMTPEATLTKLHCLLARGLERRAVCELLARNIAGEISALTDTP